MRGTLDRAAAPGRSVRCCGAGAVRPLLRRQVTRHQRPDGGIEQAVDLRRSDAGDLHTGEITSACWI
jgi:hypothetical protein